MPLKINMKKIISIKKVGEPTFSFTGRVRTLLAFCHEMNDVCNSFSTVSIRGPCYNIYVECIAKKDKLLNVNK